MKVTETLNVLISLCHVSRDTCTVHRKDIKTRYFGSILILRSRKLTFYQTRSNAIILQGTLPAHYIFKVERLKTGEVLHERPYLSPRPPPKISLRHDHNWTRGNDQSCSTVEHQPVGKLVQQSFGEAPSSKPTQSKPNPIVDRTGKPVEQENTSCSREIVGKCLQEELDSSDRTGKPVKYEHNRVMQVHHRTGKPVESRTHTQCKKLVLSNIVTLHLRAGHTVTGTGRKKSAENSTRQNSFKRGVQRNITKTFMIDLSAIRRSERR